MDATNEVISNLFPGILHALCKAVGIEIFNVTAKRISRNSFAPIIKISVPFSIYSIFITSAQAAFWMYYGISSLNEASLNGVVAWSNVSIVTSLQIATMTSSISIFFYSNSKQKIIQMLFEMNQKILQSNKEYHKRKQRNFHKILSMIILSCICQCSLEVGLMGYTSFKIAIGVICFNIYHFRTLAVSLNYTKWVYQIRLHLAMLNDQFKRFKPAHSFQNNTDCPNLTNSILLGSNTDDNPMTHDVRQVSQLNVTRYGISVSAMEVFQLRQVYDKVVKCILLVNDIYGLQMLSVLLSSLVVFTNGIHIGMFMNMTIRINRKDMIVMYISRSLVSLLQTAIIISNCQGAHMEVRNTMDTIQDLLLDAPVDGDVAEQLNMFHEQISRKDVYFCATGVFIIENALFASLAISAISYLIVLTQMSLSN